MTVVYKSGEVLPIGRLQSSLRVGESTAEEVRTALGPPDGVGSSQTPIESQPREMWAYYAERDTIESMRATSSSRTMLLVYIREGRFDGYLWFTSER
jgi:hypothetical protein